VKACRESGPAAGSFTAISRVQVNVIAIAQGSSELTIAVVVRRDGLENAVRGGPRRVRPGVIGRRCRYSPFDGEEERVGLTGARPVFSRAPFHAQIPKPSCVLHSRSMWSALLVLQGRGRSFRAVYCSGTSSITMWLSYGMTLFSERQEPAPGPGRISVRSS